MDTKQQLLELLLRHKGEYVSGQQIGTQLSVSRAAIWKAITALRAEGYQIDAVKNKGYCLSTQTDVISAVGVRKYLQPEYQGLDITVHPTLVSTNNTARENAACGASEGVVFALTQTGGKGRKGRSFFSPQGSGIYMSLLLRPHHFSAEKAASLTTMAAVAVCEAIESVCGKTAKIKWVNDVFVDGKKACGILTEAAMGIETGTLDYAIVGIGINVTPPREGFPDELKSIAGAILLSPQSDGKNRLATEVINRFMYYYLSKNQGYVSSYRSKSFILGRQITVIGFDSERTATALDIDGECRLIVRYDSGETAALSSGEISIKI